MSVLAAHEHFVGLGPVEWVAVAVAAVATAWVIWKAVGYTLHPGEKEPDHVKRLIFEDEPAPPGPAPRARAARARSAGPPEKG